MTNIELQDLKEQLNSFRPVLPEKSNYGAVIVETRKFFGLDGIIKNHLYFLGNQWGLTVFCGNNNEEFLRYELEEAGGIKNINFIKLDINDLDESKYNTLLTHPEFWNEIPYEKVLVFQHDSLLRTKGIEEFLQYDYVGASWKFQDHGGNGGLSLRTKSVMVEICKRKPYKSIFGSEDVYYCNYMHDNQFGKLAPREVCNEFSSETNFNPDCLGFHAIEKHLPEHEQELLKAISYE